LRDRSLSPDVCWQAQTMQIKFLNQYNEPLHINEFEAWLISCAGASDELKEQAKMCINVINNFIDITMYYKDCCRFNELIIVGSFRQLYYLIPNWGMKQWRSSSICIRNMPSDSMYPSVYQKSHAQTVSAFYVPFAKKIRICNAQFQNLIFITSTQHRPELVIKNCEVSYIALHITTLSTTGYRYLELNLNILTSAPSVNMNIAKFHKNYDGSYIVNMARFPGTPDVWVVKSHYKKIDDETFYYIFKELPPPPPPESCSSKPPSSECLLC
jgi:hypothetical protein